MDLRNLKQLDLSDNQITLVSSYAFVNLPQLEILSLANNHIDTIERDTFSKVSRYGRFYRKELNHITTTTLEIPNSSELIISI